MVWLTDVLMHMSYLPKEYWGELLPHDWQPKTTTGPVEEPVLETQ